MARKDDEIEFSIEGMTDDEIMEELEKNLEYYKKHKAYKEKYTAEKESNKES